MSNYIQLLIAPVTSEASDILVAQLSELGFDGFEENENALIAYCAESMYNAEAINELLEGNYSYTKELIAKINWNEEWEKNFSPVVVDDFVGVRAHFHEPISGVFHEIVITPKMSFGTGHHATTHMMMQQMQGLDFTGKKVFDFGTGTGILAILAEMLGATEIYAIDNDEWSVENAAENISNNACTKIQLALNDNPVLLPQYDIILANINKNVILAFFDMLKTGLKPNGQLLVSGLLAEDENDIVLAANALGLKFVQIIQRDKWISLLFFNENFQN
ncbi:50S ribosomal protein L11 methyltransferase [Limnovirga soli]|nr:50S ribosomal protein L11 methyltransferase [Limnovirga soli]